MMRDVGLLTACFLTIADITPMSPESRQNRLQHGDEVQFVCSIKSSLGPNVDMHRFCQSVTLDERVVIFI